MHNKLGKKFYFNHTSYLHYQEMHGNTVQTIMVDSKEAATTSSILRYSTPAPDAGSHGPSSVTLQELKDRLKSERRLRLANQLPPQHPNLLLRIR